jgi:hypothetical protein
MHESLPTLLKALSTETMQISTQQPNYYNLNLNEENGHFKVANTMYNLCD